MPAIRDDKLRSLGNINLREATDEDIERLKKMTDDELLRASSSLGCLCGLLVD